MVCFVSVSYHGEVWLIGGLEYRKAWMIRWIFPWFPTWMIDWILTLSGTIDDVSPPSGVESGLSRNNIEPPDGIKSDPSIVR